MATIAVIDYHKGNLSSVARGLVRAGAHAIVTDDPDEIRAADGAVIPGVGAFFDAIAFMHETGQDAAVLDAIAAGKPFLGICLGTQLLFERGCEGVPGDVCAPDASAYGDGLAPGRCFARPTAAAGCVGSACLPAPAPPCPPGASRCRTWDGTSCT